MSWLLPLVGIPAKLGRKAKPQEIRDKIRLMRHLSIRKTARELGINARTVVKYR